MARNVTSLMKAPSNRNDPVKDWESWLRGKRETDGIEPSLWRVHNALYDLDPFVSSHPGGSEWLTVTKGLDITEAFECHHPNGALVRRMLEKYKVRDLDPVKHPRSSPFTFEDDGFYRTLQRRAHKVLQANGGGGATQQMKWITDGLVMGVFAFIALSCWTGWKSFAVVAGVLLAMAAISAHNWFHQRDNWRMYVFDLIGLSSFEWRVTHALSHHLYPNTILDIEISALEPLLCFLPAGKTPIQRYGAVLYANVLYFLLLPVELLKRAHRMIARGGGRWEHMLWTLPLGAFLVLGPSITEALSLWAYMFFAASFWFSFVGLIAAHHHPDIWHHGDDDKSTNMDWGAKQMEAVADRMDIRNNLFFVVTMFGDHPLHHLFPTVDHSKLPLLNGVLDQTSKEFGIVQHDKTVLSMCIGKYRQLMRG